jgi:hypothetical protein
MKCLTIDQQRTYGLRVFVFEVAALALLIVERFAFMLLLVLPVVLFVLFAAMVAVAAGVIVLTATGVDARFAFVLVVVLFAASPQAIPRAPKPRTVESAITFFIY